MESNGPHTRDYSRGQLWASEAMLVCEAGRWHGNSSTLEYKRVLFWNHISYLVCGFSLYRSFFSSKMGFPCSLMMDEIAPYVLGNFKWYHREVAVPPLPLPSDYKDLCSSFDLAVAEEYAHNYDLPETPQIGIMEPALKKLQWSTFQAWVQQGQNLGQGGELGV
ncbi:hypothetical protein Cgig2_014195 [Carnegiea gigantea]|uniref:Uncharacterized protein n=1 Tax=Carnegiea gigantea TaxID=171969 RepID=A0A9Q1JXP3_9CARY|nr:hypothetical protein Cgig2_014195 [Carnegiea gigantea]